VSCEQRDQIESEPLISVGDYDGVAPGPRLKLRYNAELRDQLQTALGLENVMEVPRLEKIVVNVGAGAAIDQKALIERVIGDLTIIAGQKPIVTKAKKSIAGFKLREGNAIGVKVTLRGDRMWEFFDRLVNLAIPRIRDFRGLSPKSFDGRGNYTFGVTEQLIFPEIDYDQIDASGAWTSRSSRPLVPTLRARPCSTPSASRSNVKGSSNGEEGTR
jgi:large subunit ribosomal protein L5